VTSPLLLELRNLSAGYGPTAVVNGLNLTVRPGDFTGILGPNGAGKTTIFRSILRSARILSGGILLKGLPLHDQPYREQARIMASLPQISSAPEGFSVRDVVMAGRYARIPAFQSPSKEDRSATEQAMAEADVLPLADRPASELSGGELQRVFLAQALCQEPELLLLDEPASHLDIGHQEQIFRLLRGLNERKKTAIVMIAHDLNTVSQSCRHVLLMKSGQVVAEGGPEEVLTEARIQEVYSARVRILKDHGKGRPFIFPSI
jgi:iron complex transport system ATP-binding protein